MIGKSEIKQIEKAMEQDKDYDEKYKMVSGRPDMVCVLIRLWEEKGYHIVPGMMSQGNGGPNVLMERD